MELKVWVEGLQKIVSGVTENTTCQDIVFALAHATGKTGRYTLIERFRNNERLLTPQDQPIKELMKVGEYANEVHFILQRAQQTNSPHKWNLGTPSSSPNFAPSSSSQSQSNSLSPTMSHSILHPLSPSSYKDLRKSLFGVANHQQISDTSDLSLSSNNSQTSLRIREDKSLPRVHVMANKNSNSSSPPQLQHSVLSSQLSQNHVLPSSNNQILNRTSSPPPRKDGTHLSPPPYREPPPPTQNPARVSPPTSLTTIRVKPKKIIMKDEPSSEDTLLYNAQYRELVRLINYQRDKLSTQQMELTKYDAEIMFWEGKTREQQHQMEYMAEETLKIEAVGRQTEQQIKGLSQVEEENEIVRQQEKTLKSEITLLRSKLANCETELLQCKNKIRLLMEEVQFEQRVLAKEAEERNLMEKSLLSEVERLQKEVDQAKQDTESAAQSGDNLTKEVAALECAITEKKKQLEKLIGDMKDANLQSLTIAPSEEIKLLVDGPHKLGSTRRMIGSPRQLENAVPTSKNPHGVWV